MAIKHLCREAAAFLLVATETDLSRKSGQLADCLGDKLSYRQTMRTASLSDAVISGQQGQRKLITDSRRLAQRGVETIGSS